MFKSACFFRTAPDFVLPPLEALETVLQQARFVPCGATEPESSGWVPPRGNKSEVLAELVGGQLLLKLCTEKRAVPGSAVKAAVDSGSPTRMMNVAIAFAQQISDKALTAESKCVLGAKGAIGDALGTCVAAR